MRINTGIIKAVSIGTMLGWQDVKQAYRRSSIGPFWITLSMALVVTTMGFVFSLVFQTNITTYLPFLASGIVLWGYISSTIVEGCNSFIAGEAMIKQLQLPLLTHVVRVVWKNIIVLAHNFIIIPVVFVVVGYELTINAFLSILGMLIVTANLFWIANLVGLYSSRFRDLPSIISSLMAMFFYVTPVVWEPASLPDVPEADLLNYNPFAILLNLIRGPLMNQLPSMENWLTGLILAVIGILISTALLTRNRSKIAYWV